MRQVQEPEPREVEVPLELKSFADNYINDMRDCGLDVHQATVVMAVMLAGVLHQYDIEQREDILQRVRLDARRWAHELDKQSAGREATNGQAD